MRRGLLEEALQEACLIRYTSGSLRSRLFGSGLFHVCWDREDAHCVMVVASKCLDVERGRILSDSVTSRSGSVGRALTARDSSLRYASCALSAAQNSVPGPGPRRERHGRRVDVQCGDNRIARSLPRPGGARLRPSRCRVRVPRRPRSFTITWTKEMLPQCPPVHVDHVVRHRDMFIFYLYLLSRLHLRPNSHDHSM